MKLLYLSEANLRDRLFVKDLVHNFKLEEKAILIHDTFGQTVKDTRFVTKRLSALFSETMVYNNAFSADQRNFFTQSTDGLMELNVPLIEKLLPPIQLLLIGPVMKIEGSPQLADPIAMLQAARHTLDISETILFVDNPMSPLGAKNLVLDSEEELQKYLGIYEEEKTALELAFRLRPAKLSSPTKFAKS